jgi:hypothetical protein
LSPKKFVLNEEAMRKMGYSSEQIKFVKKESLKIFAPTDKKDKKVCGLKRRIKADSSLKGEKET